MKKAHYFRELKIWQESMKLVKMIYLLNQELPNDERFGLISQMNRCSTLFQFHRISLKVREEQAKKSFYIF
jgi:four helix bundle protein